MSWKLKAIRMKMRKKSTSNAKTNLRDIYWKQSNLHSHCSSQKKKQSVHMKCGFYIRFHGISTKELGERLCSNQILEISYFFSFEMPTHNHWLSINLTRNIFVFETYFRVNYQKSHTHTHTKTTYSQTIFFISWDISVLCPCLKRLVHCSMYTFLDH